VNNVCFPTGTALFGDTLFIYYGAADSHIACASLKLSALVAELLACTKVKGNNIEDINDIKSQLPPKAPKIATTDKIPKVPENLKAKKNFKTRKNEK
jgi:hypothetical protein